MKKHPNPSVRIWDLPIRVFHWSLAVSVVAALITVKLGGLWMEWHLRFGVTALALVTFRLIWGLFGTRYARFSQFVVSPMTTWRELRSRSSEGRRAPGHNSLGAWSVLALLLMVAYQSITGLFANDDIMVQGPFASFVSNELSARLTSWHKLSEYLIYGLISLHVIAIAYYRLRGVNLIQPMLTGDAPASELTPGSLSAQDNWQVRLIAFLLAVILGLGAWWLIRLASQAAPSFS